MRTSGIFRFFVWGSVGVFAIFVVRYVVFQRLASTRRSYGSSGRIESLGRPLLRAVSLKELSEDGSVRATVTSKRTNDGNVVVYLRLANDSEVAICSDKGGMRDESILTGLATGSTYAFDKRTNAPIVLPKRSE